MQAVATDVAGRAWLRAYCCTGALHGHSDDAAQSIRPKTATQAAVQ